MRPKAASILQRLTRLLDEMSNVVRHGTPTIPDKVVRSLSLAIQVSSVNELHLNERRHRKKKTRR